MEKILYRLLQQLPDGSFKVVGYEEHRLKIFEGGEKRMRIWHREKINNHGDMGNDLLSSEAFIYSRKDMYTGVTVGGEKVFENDEGLLNGHVLGDAPVTVVYNAPSFKVKHADGSTYPLNEYFYKVTGIHGVKETTDE